MKIFRVSFRELAERTGMGERGEDEGDLVRDTEEEAQAGEGDMMAR